jgi:hypothetical protein
MAREKMHVSTAMEISERLKKVIAVLERENTPEEYKKAVKELLSLTEEVRVDFAEKPISKKAWDNVWAGVIGDFIMAFDHNAVGPINEEEDTDHYEAFLKGMSKGMWTIYNMIEELMVREE